MTRVSHLVVHVEQEVPSAPTEQFFAARLVAVTESGTEHDLLTDRGWGASGPAASLASTTAQEVADLARMVTGPDEPDDDRSPEDEASAHWSHLSRVLAGHGVHVGPEELAGLSVRVVFGPELSRRWTDRSTPPSHR
ncbi:hypothetical protein [Nocardioides sp. CFH 31398]|uniref:hypothetical protein n=1 Tax=Nocardioides sp. CFH 31398 TaxID=2919579 RepID=UPI001F0575F6|nr:hypothetical protein [Nocardioides sp. CFH 31398]MCH1866942.1 hypothetical protein [Nocardioides sp. CFH 31398]